MMTSQELAARQERAVSAAVEAGRALGLTVEQPRVLHDVFSVVVHLAPAPVVVRVPTVLPRAVAADLEGRSAQQRVELAVAAWLARQGFPVVPPSPLVPEAPVQREGFSMTFWRLVDALPEPVTDFGPGFQATAELHAALRDCPVEARWLVPLDSAIPDSLEQLDAAPLFLTREDLARARREWALLAPLATSPEAFSERFPGVGVQRIHGDAPYYNIIRTASGPLMSDLEHTTLGPVEWDLAGVGEEGFAAYDAAATRLGLRPLDRRVLAVMEAARNLQVVACLALAPQLPLLVDALRPVLEHWRTTPLAGGMSS